MITDLQELRSLAHRDIEVAEFPDGHIEPWADGRSIPYVAYERLSETDQGRSWRTRGWSTYRRFVHREGQLLACAWRKIDRINMACSDLVHRNVSVDAQCSI